MKNKRFFAAGMSFAVAAATTLGDCMEDAGRLSVGNPGMLLFIR